MTSAPWQTWAMHVRKVYRWEDPTETAKWFATYLVLWYTQRIVTFIVRLPNGVQADDSSLTATVRLLNILSRPQ